MQTFRREHNYPSVPIQLHSVFTGNPGTGKTTVAKIYAELLKECGMLKRGHLVVVGRADLIAGYVGQSALKTKKKIQEALGGVLLSMKLILYFEKIIKITVKKLLIRLLMK